jgi:HEAT repeat protein
VVLDQDERRLGLSEGTRRRPVFHERLYYPATPTGPAPSLASLASSNSEALVTEVAAALEAPASSHAPYALLDAVGASDSAPIHAILWHIVGSSGTVNDRAEALEALIGRGDTRAIRTIVEDPMLASFSGAAADIVASVPDTFRATDHTSVAALIKLASASPAADGLNAAAIRALSAIHSRETLPFLAGLLSHPDQESRGRAMVGLAAFVNGCPMQTPDNTKSMEYMQTRLPSVYRNADTLAHLVVRVGSSDNEPEQLAFWKTWWMQHKQEFSDVPAN